MKRNFNLNKTLAFGSLLIIMFSNSSCIKNWRDGETQFSNTQPTVLIPEGGVSSNAFGAAALIFPGTDSTDTAYFHVNYAAANVAPADETITLAVDTNAVSKFNATSTVQYLVLPDSVYSFTSTQVTVKAGNNYSDAIALILYPIKVPDPTQSYMIPITIASAPTGSIISSNQNTVYFHIIGNALAGNYLQSFYRWNDVPDTTGAPNSTVFENSPVTITAESSTTITLPESYLETFVSDGISLSFTNDNGVLSNFSVFLNDKTKQDLTSGGFTVQTAPKLVSYQIVGDASTHYAGSTFRTYMEVINSSGGNRKLVDNFVKQ